MKKVSVLLSIYKESQLWLETSINSLIAQTYKDLEIIVVVDNPLISNDVVEFLDKRKANGQLDYIINENNLGLAASLNIAFSKATGEYIARLDADDYCAPERIQKQVLFLNENEGISLVGTGIWQIDEDSNIIKKSYITSDFKLLKKTINYSTIAYHPTWMLRREVFIDLNGYRNYPAAQDTDFLLRLLEKGYIVSNIEEPLVYYRISFNSISVNKSLLQRKCQIHILNCHKNRVKFGKDHFNPKTINSDVNSGEFLNFLHKKSQLVFIKSTHLISKNKRGRGVILLLMSMILSPYQAHHVCRIMKYKLVMELNK